MLEPKLELRTGFKGTICKIFVLQYPKVTRAMLYFVDLCAFIIPNVSNNVQIQTNLCYTAQHGQSYSLNLLFCLE